MSSLLIPPLPCLMPALLSNPTSSTSLLEMNLIPPGEASIPPPRHHDPYSQPPNTPPTSKSPSLNLPTPRDNQNSVNFTPRQSSAKERKNTQNPEHTPNARWLHQINHFLNRAFKSTLNRQRERRSYSVQQASHLLPMVRSHFLGSLHTGLAIYRNI